MTTMGTLPVCLEVLVAGMSDLQPAAHMSIRVGVNAHVSIRVGVNAHVNIKIGVNARTSIRVNVNAVKHKVINLLKMPCFFGGGGFSNFVLSYLRLCVYLCE